MNSRINIPTLLITSLVLVGCIRNSNPVQSQYYGSDILRLEIPEREHGYHYFETKIIKSTDSLLSFIQDIQNQKYWNGKELFLAALQDSIIEIENNSIVLFRITEGSGSIKLTIKGLYLVDNNPVVKISRYVPSILESDMAYYCYAYKVSKHYAKIIFDVERKDTIILDLH